jgi:TRAP-type C4-dicarboxylate transport system permease small subunit
MKRIFRDFSRLAMAGLFIFLGIAVCWRALDYSNPVDTSMIAPLLCVILAIVLTMTGLILAMRGGDFETSSEQRPAGQN